MSIAEALRALVEGHGERCLPGASPAAVARLRERVADVFGAEPPAEYLTVLRDQNGFEVNGLRLFGTDPVPLLADLVQHNKDLREGGGLDDHLVLAQGSSALFAMHLPTGAFHELGVVPNDVLATHSTFTDLMAAAIEAHQ